MSKKPRASRLGRGLSSLMGQPVAVANSTPVPEFAADDKVTQAPADQIQHIPVSQIRPNPKQPRQRFDQKRLEQLAASIRQDGIMQPVIVRRADAGEYELVAGERRWRAARLADLESVPGIVRDLNDLDLAEWALVENLQREDLNPIEKAEAFQGLSDHHQLSHEQIADRVGVDRSTITNFIRLLSLDAAVIELVREQLVSLGHAKVGPCEIWRGRSSGARVTAMLLHRNEQLQRTSPTSRSRSAGNSEQR